MTWPQSTSLSSKPITSALSGVRDGHKMCTIPLYFYLPPDSEVVKLDDKLLPMPSELVASTMRASKDDLASWHQRGIALIAEGRMMNTMRDAD